MVDSEQHQQHKHQDLQTTAIKSFQSLKSKTQEYRQEGKNKNL